MVKKPVNASKHPICNYFDKVSHNVILVILKYQTLAFAGKKNLQELMSISDTDRDESFGNAFCAIITSVVNYLSTCL